MKGANVGALVVSLPSAAVLYERNADLALIPASNLKVLTAVAALRAFGPYHQFVTTISADGPVNADGLVGDLCIAGGGDPALTSEQWWRIAADLRVAGLRRVTGDVVLDASHFDDVGTHPSWGVTSGRAYHAPVRALSANYGAFEVHVAPGGRPGEPVRVTVDPPSRNFYIKNLARTGPRSVSQRIEVTRDLYLGRELVRISGVLPLKADSKRFARSVRDPVGYAGAVLVMQLEAVGVEVAGVVRHGSSRNCSSTLKEFKGYPLSQIVRSFLKWSNNSIGESLIKSLAVQRFGVPGSWGVGVQVARQEIESFGVNLDKMRWIDGSGLSRENRLNVRMLVEVLARARRDFLLAPEFVAALPIGNADGTLRDRSEGVGFALRAKTGMLRGVAGLTGYVRGAQGGWLAFSVLANHYRGGWKSATDTLDLFASELRRAPR